MCHTNCDPSAIVFATINLTLYLSVSFLRLMSLPVGKGAETLLKFVAKDSSSRTESNNQRVQPYREIKRMEWNGIRLPDPLCFCTCQSVCLFPFPYLFSFSWPRWLSLTFITGLALSSAVNFDNSERVFMARITLSTAYSREAKTLTIILQHGEEKRELVA